MGKMKKQLQKYQEKEWIIEEQEKILNDIHRETSITYADLLTFDDIKKSDRIFVTMVNGKEYDFTEGDIIELHSLSIKIDYGLNQVIVLPLDKIVSVKYII